MSVAISLSKIGKSFSLSNNPSRNYFQLLFNLKKNKNSEKFIALNDITFNIFKGEALGIVGSNGSGKSTLLKIICGALEQSEGVYQVDGKIASLLELGSVFNPEFTGTENVRLAAAIYGLKIQTNDPTYNKIIDFSGLDPYYLSMPVKTYSSGMMLRLAFSIIINIKADIIIVDEALAVGDAYFNQKCIDFFKDFKKQGTLVLVSHSVGTIQSMCSRVVWIEGGSIQKIGSPKEVIEQYTNYLFSVKERIKKQRGVKNNRPNNIVENIDIWKSEDNSVELVDVSLIDKVEKIKTSLVSSKMKVSLKVELLIKSKLNEIIVGFYLKDKNGLNIFGDNTFVKYLREPISAFAGDRLICNFEFIFPRMPLGDYIISVACATGSQLDHEIKLWAHNALSISNIENHFSVGLVGLDSLDCTIQKVLKK
jgi:lipopolysaccharide transport system ATP-binding protein